MKLGVSYNLYDGEELLQKSISSIKNNVNYICVIYQNISNFGQPCNPEVVQLLKSLKENKLIDDFVLYEPELMLGPQHNELKKRNLGLSYSLKNKCTHHMCMDTDEFYIESELSKLIELIKKEDLESTFCQMVTYYKTNEYVLDPPENYYVPIIYKIDKNSKFEFNTICPVETDPWRRILPGRFKILDRNFIQMHHFSMVRSNIKSKLMNSSAKILFENQIELLVDSYENWYFPNEVLWPGKPIKKLKIKKINPLF